MLRMALGEALLARCEDLVYTVNQSLVRFMRTDATLPQLLAQIDSAVFNAVYTGTGGTMVVTLDGGRRVRITGAFIHDLADRLLALAYESLPASPSVRDALCDPGAVPGALAVVVNANVHQDDDPESGTPRATVTIEVNHRI